MTTEKNPHSHAHTEDFAVRMSVDPQGRFINGDTENALTPEERRAVEELEKKLKNQLAGASNPNRGKVLRRVD